MIAAIRKYNFWDGNPIDLGYPRTFYTDRVGQYIGSKLIKVLVGQRRVGKSYILRQIAAQLIANGIPANNIFHINKEFLEFSDIHDYQDLENLLQLYRKELQPKGKVYLFIDEIQDVEEWERFVNSHSQDFAEPCEIFISGSNSRLLAGELATLLSGRYVEFEVLPYSFSEFCGVGGRDCNKESYIEYLQTSALPELFNLPNDEMRRKYVSSIKDTVMLRDIVARYKVKDVKLLDDLFVYLVNNASNIVSIANIVNFFKSRSRKTNYETLSNYISHLESTFLVHRVERYSIKGKETIAANSKYYLNDLCYHNYLYAGFGYGMGFLLENAVYLSLRRAGYQVYVGTNGEAEVDFVAIKGSERLYFQVALQLTEQETAAREFRSLLSIDDNYRKYVVSLDGFKLPTHEGIEHISAWEIDGVL